MVLVMVLVMVPVMVRFWSVLPERRPVHLLEEPENGAELGGGAVYSSRRPDAARSCVGAIRAGAFVRVLSRWSRYTHPVNYDQT